MAGDQRIDVGTCLRNLVEVGFQSALQDVSAFGEFLDLAGDEPVDACTALRKPFKVILQRFGQAGAADGKLLDMAFEKTVDTGKIGFERLGKGFAAAVEPLQLLGDQALDDLTAFL